VQYLTLRGVWFRKRATYQTANTNFLRNFAGPM